MKKMIAPAILIALAIEVVSCSPPKEYTVQRKPENEALVQKYIDAIVKGDTASIEGFLADNFMGYGP